jgi:glycosyltransferase involved in cell wall biosynthesis
VTGTLTISVEQLYRRQPGGIATYVHGLAAGLAHVAPPDLEVLGLAPSGPVPDGLKSFPLSIVKAPLPVELLSRFWMWQAIGVPLRSTIVHATSMAGPYGGGAPGCVHSVAMHDLLWRDESSVQSSRRARFHEARLALLKRRGDIVILTSSPGLKDLLIDEGVEPERVHPFRLGIDDDVVAASEERVRSALSAQGVSGPFTLYVGTREPRKNLERLIEAHAEALANGAELGPLVLVGPPGWGGVDSATATVLGSVDRVVLQGLYRDATVVAYVALAEGWGLPPVEALRAGTRVVVSTTTPSTSHNPEVVPVDPLDVLSIAQGLVRAAALDNDAVARTRRQDSVADLTWANAARDHLAAWS